MMKKRFWHVPGFILLFLVAIEAAWLAWDIFGHHMVCHDVIGSFFIQYYRFNGLVQYGQVPLWSPFMTQGTTMLWWYALQAGPSSLYDALMLLGGYLKHMDFFALFHAGLFFDQFVLLVGTWLLSGRYFASAAARVFVMLCVVSSFVVYGQMFSFTIFYLVPLLLWLMHRFMDSAQWRWVFFAAYIYLVQIFSCNAGAVPITSLLVIVYFLFDVCAHREYYLRRCAALKFTGAFVMCLAGIAAIGLLAACYLRLAQDPWTFNGNVLREPDGSVSIGTLLTYAGNTHLNKWYELVFRFTPAMDFTLYMGMFALPCVMAGVMFSRRPEMRVWLGWTGVVFFLCIGSVLTIALYYFWPLMHFYRHLTLLSPIVKFGLCFLAGFGFEALFVSPGSRDPDASWGRNVFWISMAVLFTGAGVFMLRLTGDTALREWIIGGMVTDGLPAYRLAASQVNLVPGMSVAFMLAAACGVMLFVRDPRSFLIAGWIWVAFQGADVYAYRAAQMHLRSVQIDENSLKTMRWEPLPWRARRDPGTWVDDGRMYLLGTKVNEHVVHDFVGNFTFRDHLTTVYRTDQWSKALDYYLRAYMGVPLHAPGSINAQTPYMLHFRLDIPAALKISGVTEDKVQVFSSAYYFSSPEKVAAAMTSGNYAGDVLLLSSYEGKPFSDRKDDPVDPQALASNGRVPAPYRMVRFTPNEVIIEATAPMGRPSWLLYSDMWHPCWRARVNGAPVPVYAANLAYKAVPLVPGKNEVRFYFYAPGQVFFHWLFAWLALGMVMMVGCVFWKGLRDEHVHSTEDGRA